MYAHVLGDNVVNGMEPETYPRVQHTNTHTQRTWNMDMLNCVCLDLCNSILCSGFAGADTEKLRAHNMYKPRAYVSDCVAINPCALFFSLLLLLLLAHVIAIITALNTSALVCCVGYHFKLFVCRFFPLVGGWLLSSFIRVGDGVGWWDHLAWHIFSLYFVFLFLPRNMRGQTNARTSHTQTRYSRYVRHSFGWMVFFNQYVLVVKHFSAIFVQCIAIGFWRPRACY